MPTNPPRCVDCVHCDEPGACVRYVDGDPSIDAWVDDHWFPILGTDIWDKAAMSRADHHPQDPPCPGFQRREETPND